MSTIDIRTTSQSLKPQAHSRLYWTLADALVLAKRHLTQIPRIPDELIFATIQPIMFVLLFRYVFGGAIAVTGTSYVNYLMAGAFVQSAVFASANTGVGMANDLKRGLIDRFRSLPMAPSARQEHAVVAIGKFAHHAGHLAQRANDAAADDKGKADADDQRHDGQHLL